MPDRMVREAARFSDRLESVSKDAELMWWRMLTVPDDFGIYYADPAQLRAAIWPKNTRNIRISDVARWRDELTTAGALAAFEVAGVRYIELLRFGQAEKLRNPRRRFPERPREADDPAQMRMPLVADPPPPPKPRPAFVPKPKSTEEKGEKRAGRAPAPAPQDADAFLERLVREWPHVDVRAELRKAEATKRKQGQTGVDLAWFERHWLPGCGPVVSFATVAQKETIEPEPEAWRVWLEHEYPDSAYGKGGREEGTAWAELPKDVRAKIAREMARSA